MRFFKCIECGQEGHLKCTKEVDSISIKIDAKVINDLNEFIVEKFREADDIEDSENGGNPEVDAFDYVKTSKSQNKKKKKSNKLTKSQKRLR